MNRRNLLKSLGIGAAVAAVTNPQVLAEQATAQIKKEPEQYSLASLKEMLKYGTDRNMIVYDCNAQGNLTKKLLYLMLNVADDDIHHMYIPRDSFPVDFDPWEKVYGITFTRTKELNEDGELTKYYTDELKGSFMSGYFSPIIAVGKKDILLGMC